MSGRAPIGEAFDWGELQGEHERVIAERDRLRQALGFAASAIKSGEPWTEECERMIGGALAGAPAAPPPRRRCGWCGGYEDELADPHGPCPLALDADPQTGEEYVCGPHQYVEEAPAAPPPPSLPPEVQMVLKAASRWVDAAAAPAPEFEPCDACIIYGPDIDNPAKHPQEECPVTEGARLAWSERRVAASTELHAAVAALRARKEQGG